MSLRAQLASAVTQLALVVAVSLLVYLAHRLVRGRHFSPSFAAYLGLETARDQLDRRFLLMLLALVAFGALSTVLEFQWSPGFRHLLVSRSSPYGAILRHGFGGDTIILGLVYCFVQAAAAEEILFRGLIGRRLYSLLGELRGNVLQALVFWLMHLIIFRFLTGRWFSGAQLIVFFTSFGMGLLLGYSNLRKRGNSILPSWILHGSCNFAAFVALGCLMS